VGISTDSWFRLENSRNIFPVNYFQTHGIFYIFVMDRLSVYRHADLQGNKIEEWTISL
jgi:hypothetical protein